MSADIAHELYRFLWGEFGPTHYSFVSVLEGRDSLPQLPFKGVDRELRGFRYGPTVDAVYTLSPAIHIRGY